MTDAETYRRLADEAKQPPEAKGTPESVAMQRILISQARNRVSRWGDWYPAPVGWFSPWAAR